MIVRASEPIRADKLVARTLPAWSRQAVSAAFAQGRVRMGGRPIKKGRHLEPGESIEVDVGAESPEPVPEAAATLEVLHEDEHLVAVAKPPGVATHPLRPGETGTLANALVARFPECARASEDPREGGLAHRLDIGTSGVLLAARTRDAWVALRRMFHDGRVHKEYLALARGRIEAPLVIDRPIVQAHRKKVLVGPPTERADAVSAETRVEPVEHLGGHTLVRCVAETGRMHQVRAHLASVGHPLVGDEIYGERVEGDPPVVGHFLHASRVSLTHPATHARLTVEAPLPPDRQEALSTLRAPPGRGGRR